MGKNIYGEKYSFSKGAVVIFISFIMWLSIFSPPILSSFNIIHMIGAASIVYLAICRKFTFRFITIEVLFALIYLYVLVHSIFNNAVSIVQNQIYYFADIIPISFCIYHIAKKHKFTYEDFEKCIIIAGVIAAFLSFCSLLSEDVHTFFIEKSISGRFSAEYYNRLQSRIYGFSSNPTYSSPIATSIIALILYKRMLQGKGFYNFLISLWMFAMSYISARTSLLIYCIGVLALVFLYRKNFKRIIISLVVVVAFIISSYVLLKNSIDASSEYDEQIYWLYDGIANIFSVFSNDVTAYHETMSYYFSNDKWILPTSGISTLFGTGETIMARNSYNVYSDIGYVNDMWYGGLLYSLTIYTLFMYLCVRIRNKLNLALTEKKREGDALFLIFFLSVLIANVKGIVFEFTNVMVLFAIYSTYILSSQLLEEESIDA